MPWRSVDDPPEPGKLVLLLTGTDPDDQVVGFHDPECGPDWWWECGMDRREFPIRWMPLPDLPDDLTADKAA
jgi:hypothetical protein